MSTQQIYVKLIAFGYLNLEQDRICLDVDVHNLA
jgi:hypothetical protein